MGRPIIVAKLFGCLLGPLTIYVVALKLAEIATGKNYLAGGWMIIKYMPHLLAAGVAWLAIVLLLNRNERD